MPSVFSHSAVPLALGAGLGHRGFSHSLLAAAVVALAGAAAAPALRARFARAFVFLFVAAASHGALDACTNGGLGVAFLSARGAAVLESEVRWIWLPALALGLILVGARRARSRRRPGGHA